MPSQVILSPKLFFSSWQPRAPGKEYIFFSVFGPQNIFFLMAVQKKRKKNVFRGSSGPATLKYSSQSFDWNQILSQSNCSDWWRKLKLKLTYLRRQLWLRVLTKNKHFIYFFFLGGGGGGSHFFLQDGSELQDTNEKYGDPQIIFTREGSGLPGPIFCHFLMIFFIGPLVPKLVRWNICLMCSTIND